MEELLQDENQGLVTQLTTVGQCAKSQNRQYIHSSPFATMYVCKIFDAVINLTIKHFLCQGQALRRVLKWAKLPGGKLCSRIWGFTALTVSPKNQP
jgi:hypothetical protein